MNLREKVLDYQLNLTTGHCFRANLPLFLESWKKTSGRPLGERFAVAGADRLEAINFIHTAEEPLIGRDTVTGKSYFSQKADLEVQRARAIQMALREAARAIVQKTTEEW